MRKVIVYRTSNPTPNIDWDYIAHYEGECEDKVHRDLHEFGKNPVIALQNFLLVVEQKINEFKI